LADHNSPVEIEKLPLLEHGLNDPLLDAFSKYERRNPQFGVDWLTNLAAHALGKHEKAILFVARLTPDNFVALPLKLDSNNGQAHALGNFYTSAYSPVICSKTPETLLLALFQYLAKIEKITALDLSPMNADSPFFNQIQCALEQSEWRGIHRFLCFGNWTHELDGVNYESYLATRPSRLSNTIARRTRQFLQADRGQLKLVQEGHLLEESIKQFVAVYNSSWKQEEPYPDFIPQLLQLSASRGWLRLGIASYDNVAVASQIWLVWERTAYIFKLAHDKAFKQLSPGTVLTAYMMENVIDQDRVSRIDFLSGDDEYKKDWMSARTERFGIAAYNPLTLRGGGLLIGHRLKAALKYFRSPTATGTRH
jgi:hypothetical protein